MGFSSQTPSLAHRGLCGLAFTCLTFLPTVLRTSESPQTLSRRRSPCLKYRSPPPLPHPVLPRHCHSPAFGTAGSQTENAVRAGLVSEGPRCVPTTEHLAQH